MNILLPVIVLTILVLGFLMCFLKKDNILWRTSLIIVSLNLVATIVVAFTFNSENTPVILPLFSDFGIIFRLNEVGLVLSVIASVAWLISIIISREYFAKMKGNLTRYYATIIITLASTLGIFYSGDLFTLLVFFEIMSFASFFWVIFDGDAHAIRAGKRYLAYSVIGGLAILFGIFMPYFFGENIRPNYEYLAAFSMFIGFGIKAGALMLNDWCPTSYRYSPSPATAILSGVLSKAGVYGVLLIGLDLMYGDHNWAIFILLMSVCTMIYGGVFAFFSRDLKKIFAFSSISQIGFILFGIGTYNLLGEHNLYASYGIIFHTINHSIIKVILFSLSGIIYQNKHTLKLGKLEGFGKGKKWLHAMYLMASASLMGVPLFSGYVSKTLLHESVLELAHVSSNLSGIYGIFDILFTFAGALTTCYVIKTYICLFVRRGKHEEIRTYVTFKTKITITALCVFMMCLGLFPNVIFGEIGEFVSHYMNTHHNGEIAYFSLTNLQGSLISISLGVLIYVFIARYSVAHIDGYNDYQRDIYSLDKKYYLPIISCLSFFGAIVARLFDVIADVVIVIMNRVLYKSVEIPIEFFEGKEDGFDKTKPEIHITYSLSYSLLLFGIGFIFTIIYLVVVGTN